MPLLPGDSGSMRRMIALAVIPGRLTGRFGQFVDAGVRCGQSFPVDTVVVAAQQQLGLVQAGRETAA